MRAVLVVSAPREVDLCNSDELRRALLAAADRAVTSSAVTSSAVTSSAVTNDAVTNGTPTVAVDLSSTAFFDVTALGVLAAVSRKLAAAGGELRVVGASPQTRRCMRITGDDRLYRIFGSLPEALGTGATTDATTDATSDDASDDASRIRKPVSCRSRLFATARHARTHERRHPARDRLVLTR